MKIFALFFLLFSCSSVEYETQVKNIDLDRFMKKWFVVAGRVTFLEAGAHNAIETYTWNSSEKRIDVDFTFNKDSFDGLKKTIKQKAWIYNNNIKAHWKISPFWPVKLDYLILAVADDYSWTAIGVPSGKYLWIMTDKPFVGESELTQIIQKLSILNYPISDIKRIPHERA